MADAIITANITADCSDLNCISFVDTTKIQSSGNPNGYGGGNTPALSDINKVKWVLTDIGGDHSYETTNSSYFPNSAGNNELCLQAAFFSLSQYQIGNTYSVAYSVFADEFFSLSVLNNGVATDFGVPQSNNGYAVGAPGSPVAGRTLAITCFGETITYTIQSGDTGQDVLAGWHAAYTAYLLAHPSSLWATTPHFSIDFSDPNVFYLNFSSEYVPFKISTEFFAEPVSLIFPCCGAAITSNLGTRFAIDGVQGCGSLDFTDITGTYNADTNPGGYGTPNPSYGDITRTTIEITLQDGTVKTITNFIPTADNQTININAHTLGYADNIPDQIITVTYKVYIAGDCRVGYSTAKVLLDCNTLACLQSKSCDAIQNICAPCVDEQAASLNIVEMWIEYDLIVTAANNGNWTCLEGAIEALYKKCSKGCTPC